MKYIITQKNLRNEKKQIFYCRSHFIIFNLCELFRHIFKYFFVSLLQISSLSIEIYILKRKIVFILYIMST